MSWNELFSFTLSPWELVVRGSALYWFLFFIFRVVMPRDVGAITVADVLLLVLIADASQNAMAGEYQSISEGFVLITTLVFWNVALDWLAFRFPFLRKWLEPPSLLLISNGQVLHRNLRKEFLSVDELKARLRQQGIEDFSEVKKAYLESGGEFSVIKYKNVSEVTKQRSAHKIP